METGVQGVRGNGDYRYQFISVLIALLTRIERLNEHI
jgi:hypothetical protein